VVGEVHGVTGNMGKGWWVGGEGCGWVCVGGRCVDGREVCVQGRRINWRDGGARLGDVDMGVCWWKGYTPLPYYIHACIYTLTDNHRQTDNHLLSVLTSMHVCTH